MTLKQLAQAKPSGKYLHDNRDENRRAKALQEDVGEGLEDRIGHEEN